MGITFMPTHTVEPQLPDLRLPDILFYMTCHVVKMLYYIYQHSFYNCCILQTLNLACNRMDYTLQHIHVSTF
jgi:hypothetical protein